MIKIPFNPKISSRQKLRIDLGSLVCMFFINWNVRDAAWYIDITADDKQQKSIRVNANQRLIINDFLLGIEGNLFCINETNTKESITYDNFGKDYSLFWFSKNDLEELKK